MGNNKFDYKPKSKSQLKSWHSEKVRLNKSGFTDFNDFFEWYFYQPKYCHYCGLKEEESQLIVMKGLLKSKRFPQNGIIGRGTNRGVWLEVDRIDSNGLYDRNNCVLACYFCNNDKSDVFDGNRYNEFYQNRYKYLKSIINKSKDK